MPADGRITLSQVLSEWQTAGKANVWLASLDVTRPQEALAKTPGLNPPFGTGHSNIKKLASARIKVTSIQLQPATWRTLVAGLSRRRR